MYVAAVVFTLNGYQWEDKIVIGNGSSYHYNGMIFYNAPLIKGFKYHLFVRAYSFNHTNLVSLLIIFRAETNIKFNIQIV